MAVTDQQILQILQQIENHAKKLSGDSTKIMADAADNGGDTTAFDKSNKGLIAAFISLREAVKKNEKIITRAAKEHENLTKQNSAANKALSELRESIKNQLAEGKRAATINKNVRNSLNDLKNMGVDLGTSFATITDQNKGEFLTSIDNAQISLNELAKSAKNAIRNAERENKERERIWKTSQKAFFSSFLKGGLAALGTMTTRISQAAIEVQATGFQFAPGVGGGEGFGGVFDTIGGIFGASIESFAAGASMEEALRFSAQHRAALSTMTQSSMLTAQEGLSSVEAYGDTLRDTFGFRGQAQLNAVGKSLTILTNLGIKPTIENLDRLGQGIENVAKTSNLAADELFSEFATLAEDSNFQAFFMALGDQGDIFDRLSNSFLRLQKSVGLSAKEFLTYQKFLAEQRRRTGSERVVQAAFVGTIAQSMGLGETQASLLQQGAAFYESLSLPEQKQFDELYNQLRLDLTIARQEAARTGDVRALEAIDIVMREAGMTELTAIPGRAAAGVVEAQRAAQGERVAAAKKDTEALVEFNATVREWIDGFVKSPLSGLGFFAGMTSSVFAGTLAGNLAAGKGGGAIGALGKAGLLGTLGMGAFGLATAAGAGEVGRELGQGLFNIVDAFSFDQEEQVRKNKEDALFKSRGEFLKADKDWREAQATEQGQRDEQLIEELRQQRQILMDQLTEMEKKVEEQILTPKSQNEKSRKDTRGK